MLIETSQDCTLWTWSPSADANSLNNTHLASQSWLHNEECIPACYHTVYTHWSTSVCTLRKKRDVRLYYSIIFKLLQLCVLYHATGSNICRYPTIHTEYPNHPPPKCEATTIIFVQVNDRLPSPVFVRKWVSSVSEVLSFVFFLEFLFVKW